MSPPKVKSRKFSEAVDIEAVMMPALGGDPAKTGDDKTDKQPEYVMYHAPPTRATLKEISLTYGNSQIVTAIVGGFAITPSVAASSTMFGLGAEGLAPQIGSVLLLFVFYMTDFQIVGYIPKPAFSAMLVLAFIDMINTWFYKSWFKTKDKMEWIVVPSDTESGPATKERTPDYLILDLTLVTGMDTSTVDIFSDIRSLCKANKCKLLMAGMSPNIRSILALGGFKADTGVRSKRHVRFFPNLDTALGKAEDMLLENRYVDTEPEASLTDRRRRVLDQKKDNGFRVALTHIDAE
ncbi:MAG: hypothetical protein SGILL_010164, partial [Bacillariaceae sp.]